MLDLKGINLPERQKELNSKVKEAIDNKVPFDAIKSKHEATDVDKMFKIDLASNYNNIDYILETLKSGDSLYISRALKCTWLYNDSNSNIINPDYLHDNVFPHMSIKMMKKMLTTIAMHLKSENRSMTFYNYCINKKLTNIALKFLILTSESFKLDLLKDDKFVTELKFIVNVETKFYNHFFGNSFTLLHAYLNWLSDWEAGPLLLTLRYFYSVSDVKYLELIEKYVKADRENLPENLGLRISKGIMKMHKDKVRNKPLLYMSILNKKMLVKYSSVEDAKLFAVALLPPSVSVFWKENFRQSNKHILDILPKQELFLFLKKIFTDAYPDSQFEMSVQFYNYGYYELLTVEEKEAWALRHIESEKEILGKGLDFKWYQFVNFNMAFKELKKYILKATDVERRYEIIYIMVESAKTQRDLEKVLKYYYERHVNESSSTKELFMNTVMQIHNVYEFDENCWNAFNKIFYSMGIYNDPGTFYITDFRIIVVIYNIVCGKEIPKQLKDVLNPGFNYLHTSKLTQEKRKILYKYLLDFYIGKIKEYDGKKYESDVKKSIRRYISIILRILVIFDKTKDDCPDIVVRYIKLDYDTFKHHQLLKEKVETQILEEDDLIRLLKKDATMLKDKYSDIKDAIKNNLSFKLNKLMRKLKIYFSQDIAKEYLNFFLSLLTDSDSIYLTIYTSVYCIFQLADEDFKEEFMLKYAPDKPKIDHEHIDPMLLYTQEAICRYVCYSRPPVVLSYVLIYLKGDYVHYCLPIFNHYFVNLPRPQATKFVEATINAPLSIQKHALRLAFKCYTVEDLKNLALSMWKKTKNISLRLILYKNLFNKIINEDDVLQRELYEALKVFTLELKDDDDKDIFNLLTSNDLNKLSKSFKGDFLKSFWIRVSMFKEKGGNIEHLVNILKAMKSNILIMDRNFLMENIINPHIQEMLIEKKIRPTYKIREMSEMVKMKWALFSKYIVTATDEEAINESIELATSVITTCAKMWNQVHNEKYTLRLFCMNFISSLKAYSDTFIQNFKYVNKIFERVLSTIQDVLPSQEIYITVWDLQMVIATRKVCSMLECDEHGQFKNIDFEDTCDKYANEIGQVVVDHINNGKFYSSFLPLISELIKKHIFTFSCVINFDGETSADKVCIEICKDLTRFVLPEVYLLVIMVLPTDWPREYYDNYRNVLQKIEEMENDEIQYFMYERLVRETKFRKLCNN